MDADLAQLQINPPDSQNRAHGNPDDPRLQLIANFAPMLYDSQEDVVYTGVDGFKTMLSNDNPPIRQVLESGVTAKLIELGQHPSERVQYRAIWALSNLCSGTAEQSHHLLNEGALELFKHQLENGGQIQIREQACWAIGNIAGDGPELRDRVLSTGVMPLILELMQSSNLSCRRISAWTCSNLCRGKPMPPLSEIIHALPVAADRVIHETDQELLIDSLWVVCFLSPREKVHPQLLSYPGLMASLFQCARRTELSVIVPALQTMAHMAAGDDVTTKALLALGLADIIATNMTHPKNGIQKEAFYMCSNVFAGDVETILTNWGLLLRCIDAVLNPKLPSQVASEAWWCVANALTGMNKALMTKAIQDIPIVKVFLAGMQRPSPPSSFADTLLDGLERFVKFDSKNGTTKGLLSSSAGLLEDAAQECIDRLSLARTPPTFT